MSGEKRSFACRHQQTAGKHGKRAEKGHKSKGKRHEIVGSQGKNTKVGDKHSESRGEKNR